MAKGQMEILVSETRNQWVTLEFEYDETAETTKKFLDAIENDSIEEFDNPMNICVGNKTVVGKFDTIL